MSPAPAHPDNELSGPPLWTLTAVVVLVSGGLFFLVRQPLAASLDVLLPSPSEERAAPDASAPATSGPSAAGAAESTDPEPTEPEPVVWTLPDAEAALDQGAADLRALLEAAREELPTYGDLGAADQAVAQRAAARWQRWGAVWHNRVDAVRAQLPTVEACVPHAGLEARCRTVHGLLDQADRVAGARILDEATATLDAAVADLDLYLNPAEEEEGEGGEGDDEGSGDGSAAPSAASST